MSAVNDERRAQRSERIRSFLADHDASCPRCEYNLRGLVTPACPECGDELDVGIRLADPKMGPYIAVLTAAALGFGGAALMAAVAAVGAPTSWWRDSTSARVLLVMLACFSIALPIVLLQRRRLWRAARSRQRAIAIVLWIVLAGMAVGFIVTFED